MFANLFANDRFVIELSRKHRVVVPKPLVCFLELVPKLYSTDVFFGWANLVYFLNEKCSIFKCEVFFKHLVGSQLNWSQVGDIVVGSCDPDNIRVNAKVEAQMGKRSGQQIESVQTKKKVIKCKKQPKKRTTFFGFCAACCFSCARLIRCLNAVSVAGEPNSVNCELWIADFNKVTMTNYMTLKCIEIHLKDITVKINDSWNIRIVVDIYNIYIYNISIYNCKCKYHPSFTSAEVPIRRKRRRATPRMKSAAGTAPKATEAAGHGCGPRWRTLNTRFCYRFRTGNRKKFLTNLKTRKIFCDFVISMILFQWSNGAATSCPFLQERLPFPVSAEPWFYRNGEPILKHFVTPAEIPYKCSV